MHDLVTFVAKFFILIPLLCAAATFFLLRTTKLKIRFAILVVLSGIAAYVMAKIGSQLYYDPRPFVAHNYTPYFAHANDNGFPSDHTLLSFVLAFSTLKYNKRLGVIAIATGSLVGLARVVAGVHHFADIFGSVIFAFLGVLISWYVISWINRPSRTNSAVS